MYVSSDDPHDEPIEKQQQPLHENETPHATQTSKHFKSVHTTPIPILLLYKII